MEFSLRAIAGVNIATIWQRNEVMAVRCYSAMMGASVGTAPDTPLDVRMDGKSALPKAFRSTSDSDHPAATPLSLRLGRAPPKESAPFANPLARADASATASCKFVMI